MCRYVRASTSVCSKIRLNKQKRKAEEFFETMASQFRKILTKLFGSPEYRVLILGLDGSGSTSILFKLKLNEFIQTIPTIGFNVETIVYNKTALTIWDVGGCDKIRPLIKHYFENTRAIIFVVDAQDTERFDEMKKELWRLIGDRELGNVPVLIYLNKTDLPHALQPEYVITEMGLNDVRCRQWFLQPCSARTGSGLYAGLDWLIRALKSPLSAEVLSTPEHSTENNNFEEKYFQWLCVVDNDTIEEFIEKLEKHQLNVEAFDHRTLLRSIWSFLKAYGRQKTVKVIFENIKGYKTDMNMTLIYFWIQIVHYACEATKNPTNDFMGFLLMNPQLLNETDLPLTYYDQDTLFSVQAKETVILPNLKKLPSILPSSTHTSEKILQPVAEQPIHELSDDDFLQEFESSTLDDWSHRTHLRMAWLYLTRFDRRHAVNKIFDGIKNFIQNSQAARKTTFHFTMTYFWIQMIDFAIAQSHKCRRFDEFLHLNPHLMNGGLFLEYYKKETLLNNPIARQGMVLPDIKPLPTMVPVTRK